MSKSVSAVSVQAALARTPSDYNVAVPGQGKMIANVEQIAFALVAMRCIDPPLEKRDFG
jgi:hypothetical protein